MVDGGELAVKFGLPTPIPCPIPSVCIDYGRRQTILMIALEVTDIFTYRAIQYSFIYYTTILFEAHNID